jgi:hypothetical protein
MARFYNRKASANADFGTMVHEVGQVEDGGGNTYKVAIYQYDNGAFKVSIEKLYWSSRDGSYQHASLGRLTPEVAAALGPMLVQGANSIRNFLLTGSF